MTFEQQQRVVAIARSLIGRPYMYGATPEQAPEAFDCSSFTQYCMKQVGIEIPRSSILQAADESGTAVAVGGSEADLQPGDLVFFRGQRGYYRDSLFSNRPPTYIGHVGIYSGNGSIVHCHQMHDDHGVHEEPLATLGQDTRYTPILARRW